MPKRKLKQKQTKAKPKEKINPFEKKVSELDKLVPFRICLVCARESRELVMVRPGKFRCTDCKPGNPNWLDWYEQLSPNDPERTSIGDNIYKYGRKL